VRLFFHYTFSSPSTGEQTTLDHNQFLAALQSPRFQYITAASGTHPFEETVFPLAGNSLRLISSLWHFNSLKILSIQQEYNYFLDRMPVTSPVLRMYADSAGEKDMCRDIGQQSQMAGPLNSYCQGPLMLGTSA
jgi:hypothetical protein